MAIKTGVAPRLRQKVAAGLGLSPADLPNGKGGRSQFAVTFSRVTAREEPCKFRHLQRDFEFDARVEAALVVGVQQAPLPPGRRHDLYDILRPP